MKKFLSLLLIIGIFTIQSEFAVAETLDNDFNIMLNQQLIEKPTVKVHTDAPVWAEYVAPKYRNPRADFSKKASISELAVGIVLTELIITAPIGIPMIVHGTTKVKMISYNNRKNIFDEEIAKAQLIENNAERVAVYQNILTKCHLKESTRQHYAKKEAKMKAKAEKKAKNLEK